MMVVVMVVVMEVVMVVTMMVAMVVAMVVVAAAKRRGVTMGRRRAAARPRPRRCRRKRV